MNKKEVLIHIGCHKTGSSSLQAWLNANRSTLIDAGIYFYEGLRSQANHAELAECSLRSGVETTDQIMGSFSSIPNLESATKDNILRVIDANPKYRLLFSSENLSLLRTEEECQKLASLFPDCTKFKIIVVIREKSDFFRSYRNQILKDGGGTSTNPKSARYVAGDNWLLDFEALLDAYRNVFGAANVKVFDYKSTGLISEILSFLGIEYDSEGEPQINKSVKYPFFVSFKYRARRKIRKIKNWLGSFFL